MPNYEYHCPVCGTNFEVRLPIDDKSLIRCPVCRSEAKRKSVMIFEERVQGFSEQTGQPMKATPYRILTSLIEE